MSDFTPEFVAVDYGREEVEVCVRSEHDGYFLAEVVVVVPESEFPMLPEEARSLGLALIKAADAAHAHELAMNGPNDGSEQVVGVAVSEAGQEPAR